MERSLLRINGESCEEHRVRRAEETRVRVTSGRLAGIDSTLMTSRFDLPPREENDGASFCSKRVALKWKNRTRPNGGKGEKLSAARDRI